MKPSPSTPQERPTAVGKYIDLYREHCATTPMLNNQECEVIERLAEWARALALSEIACKQPDPCGPWGIWYEDAAVEPELFFGAGAEQGARARFAVATLGWNCHLLAAAPESTRTSDAFTLDVCEALFGCFLCPAENGTFRCSECDWPIQIKGWVTAEHEANCFINRVRDHLAKHRPHLVPGWPLAAAPEAPKP